MKLRGIAATAVIAVTALQPMAALADEDKLNQCLEVYQIDHTRVVDDQNILFYLKGGRVLKNTLDFKCVGLRLSSRGFTYVAHNDEICGNLQSIKVNDTGEICELGPFARYTPVPPQEPPSP